MAVNLGTAVGYLDLDTSKFSKGFKSAISDLKTFSKSTTSTTDKFASLGSAMTSIGSTLTKTVTVPLLGIGTTAVTIAAGFESSMSKVAAISGATGSDLEALSSKAREMGATTQFSASEAADALSYMAMAGWKTEDMLNGISGVMYLAAASGEDLATTSDIVTDALTAFGLTAADSSHFANILAAASSNANTNVSMMGETFKYAAPIAGALGFSVEDTAEAIGLMANAGIKGSQAGTTLRTVMTNLSGEVKIAGKNLGTVTIATTNADGSMRGLNDILSDCRVAFQGLSESEKAAAAETLVGKNAMSGFLALMNAAPEDIDKLRTAIENSEGAAESMANTMQDNLGGQLKILKSSFEELAISVGNMLLPMVKDVVAGIQGVVTWFNGLSDSQKETIVRIAELAAAIGPLMMVIGKMLTVVSGLVSYWKTLSTALSAGKGILAALGGSFGPVLLTIAAVVAAVVALKLAWDNNFGGIQEKTAELGEALSNMFNNLVSVLQTFGSTIMSLWEGDWNGIRTTAEIVWGHLENAFSACLDAIIGVVDIFSAAFQGDWSAVWIAVKDVLKNVGTVLKELLSAGLDALVGTLIAVGAALWEAAKSAFDNIKDAFSSVWDSIVQWFESAKEDPVAALSSIGTEMYATGREILTQLWEGLKSVWSALVGWLSDIANDIKNILTIKGDVSVETHSEGSSASGLKYVPRNMFVKVHEGESIRTKQQTQEDLKSSGGDTYNFYSPTPIDEMEAAKQMKRVKLELAEGF